MKLSIILPTFNERENIKELIPEIKKEFSDAEIIVGDDDSPDQTAITAERLGVKVIRRKNREGLGAALKDGYSNAKGDVLVSMGADCSISVKDVRFLLEGLKKYNIVIGSKYSKGSRAEGFASKLQKILSFLGNKGIKFIYGLKVDDVTLNFRAFKKATWEKLNLKEKTNVFLLEMLIDAKNKNLRIGQIPIIFSQRRYGESQTSLYKLMPLYIIYTIRYFLKF